MMNRVNSSIQSSENTLCVTGDVCHAIQQRLFALQDVTYRDFQSKLIPHLDPATIIGVRTPLLRKLAKEIAATEDATSFLKTLPHTYHEENNLHGLLIERMKSYDECIEALEEFLPAIDNWATCDIIRPCTFKKNLPALCERITTWINSEHPYTIRFGIEMLMSFYLDDAFCTDYLEMVAAVTSEEYYVNMMIAWFFATALAKQYEATLPYLTHRRLAKWTHNKTIQKAIESYRITDEQKAYLRTLRQ